MKLKIITIGLLTVLLANGCAYNRSVTLDTENTKTGVKERKTTARAYTFFDSHSALTGVQVKVGDTNGANGTFVNTLNQDSASTTNLTGIVSAITEAAIKGAVIGAKTP